MDLRQLDQALLMNCVYNDMAATIKPMAAIYLEGERGRKWRPSSPPN